MHTVSGKKNADREIDVVQYVLLVHTHDKHFGKHLCIFPT